MYMNTRVMSLYIVINYFVKYSVIQSVWHCQVVLDKEIANIYFSNHTILKVSQYNLAFFCFLVCT